jgi:hypothetical protein
MYGTAELERGFMHLSSQYVTVYFAEFSSEIFNVFITRSVLI